MRTKKTLLLWIRLNTSVTFSSKKSQSEFQSSLGPNLEMSAKCESWNINIGSEHSDGFLDNSVRLWYKPNKLTINWFPSEIWSLFKAWSSPCPERCYLEYGPASCLFLDPIQISDWCLQYMKNRGNRDCT